jgi:hypothetical protein
LRLTVDCPLPQGREFPEKTARSAAITAAPGSLASARRPDAARLGQSGEVPQRSKKSEIAQPALLFGAGNVYIAAARLIAP